MNEAIESTPQLIKALYDQGYSVIVNDLQDKNHCTFSLCQMLSSIFVAGVNCNAYMSPHSSQALSKHYDDEDVLVIQVTGTKTWKIYAPSININPTPSTLYSEDYVDQCATFAQLSLSPGTALYIPKGVPHEALSNLENSLHLTFSISTPDIKQLLQELLEHFYSIAIDSLGIRSRIPLQSLSSGKLNETVRTEIKSVLKALLSDIENNDENLERALGTLIKTQCDAMRSPMLCNGTLITESITSDSLLQPDLKQLLACSPIKHKAYFKGGDIDISSSSLTVIRKIQQGKSVQVSELPGDNVKEQINAAIALITNGLVEAIH